MALSLHQLCVDRPAGAPGGPARVLTKISLAVLPGRHVAVAGQPRFGGTLLAQAVAGIRQPAGGEIRLYGADLAGEEPARRPVAFIPSGGGLLPQLSLRRNIVLGARLRGRTVRRWRLDDLRERDVEHWLELFSLAECAERVPDWVSGTQRLLAALARALVRMPEVLVIDATGGPDPDRAYRTMLASLRRTELGRRLGVLLCTTRERLLADCDEVLVVTDQHADRPDAGRQDASGPDGGRQEAGRHGDGGQDGGPAAAGTGGAGRVVDRGRLVELRDRCTPTTAPVLFGDPLLIVPGTAERGPVVLTPDEIAVELVEPGDTPAGRPATVRTPPDGSRFQDVHEHRHGERWRLRLAPGQHLPVGTQVTITGRVPS